MIGSMRDPLPAETAREKLLKLARKILGELAFCVPTCITVHWFMERLS